MNARIRPSMTTRDVQTLRIMPSLSTVRCVVILAFLAVASVKAEFVKEPYLQSMTDSSVVVCWQTAMPQPGKVIYGLTTGYGQVTEHLDSTSSHELLLTELISDTLYHFRAISGSDSSADLTFHTPVTPAGRFRFIVYGDNRTDSAAHQSVVDRMMLTTPAPRLLVNVGDLTEDGTSVQYQTFFNIERYLLSRMPLFPAMGNHDARNLANWFSLFALPGNERWYSFRYGNSAFHCVDTESDFAPASEQYEWLLAELRSDSADSSIRYVFVYLHKPPYTTNRAHLPDIEVQQYLCPLFERYGVAAVFAGHVHAYEHSYVNGVHYVITGGGGAPLHMNWNPPDSWTVYREATYQFTVVDVERDSVVVHSVRPDGSEFDRFVVLSSGPVQEGPDSRLSSWARAGVNPFRGAAKVCLELSRPGRVSLTVLDPAGRQVGSRLEEFLTAGRHELVWQPPAGARGPLFGVLATPQGQRVLRFLRF
uniref:Metallophosphoesterase family protein n=1 Tax=candidate division WOR-3 bacterium TaxID=2052148 RepID=A0A7C4CEV6_UNCW3